MAAKFIPIAHLIEVPRDRAILLYAIKANLSINVGWVIKLAIIYTTRHNHVGLPFPSLLMKMIELVFK